MTMGHILVVDDEKSILKSLKGILADEGHKVSLAEDGNSAMKFIKRESPDVVLLDIWIPGMDGIETLRSIKEFSSDLEVIMMTGHGSIDTAVKAVKLGAFDFIEKPLSLENVIYTTHNALEQQRLRRERLDRRLSVSDNDELIGEIPKIAVIRKLIEEAGSKDDSVFISGEAGSGKELVARMIHKNSRRKKFPFIKVNCATLSLENTDKILFGYRDSSESGHTIEGNGKIKEADRGTLFLDEIDHLDRRSQKKILKFLDTGFIPSGRGKKNIGANVRIIAATDREKKEITKSGFNKNLLDKLSVMQISMPPLRERSADIPLLVKHFLTKISGEYRKRPKKIDDDALTALVNFEWPGNVMELKNVLERMILTTPVSRITIKDLPQSIRDSSRPEKTGYLEFNDLPFDEARKKWERNFLAYNLQKYNYDVEETARRLSLTPDDAKRKISEYGIMIAGSSEKAVQYQRTLKRSVVLCGQGLHSGLKTGLILMPMPVNSGILFGNISSGDTVPALIDYVESSEYATTIRRGYCVARTIEHLMAVLHMYRITNLMIKISDEVPIMDGSANDFCHLIEDGGIEEQDAPAQEVIIDKKYTYTYNGDSKKRISIEPSETFGVEYKMEYPPPVGKQNFSFEYGNSQNFRQEIAPARTFGFVKEVEKLGQRGLVSGGRLDNVILVDEDKIINTELRFPNEFVRHKILDIIGDFYLLGKFIQGKVKAHMTGHTGNIGLLEKIKDL